MTGSRQLIKAVTATMEYKIPLAFSAITFRTEYRFDESIGSEGGFLKAGQGGELIGGQHLVLFSCLLTLDKP